MKKTLALFLSVIMVLATLVPMSVFAQEPTSGFRVTKADNSTVDTTTIEAAVSALEAGSTLKMYENATITSALVITENNITIDGNGKKITVTSTADSVRTFNLEGSTQDSTFNKNNRQKVTMKNLDIDFNSSGPNTWAMTVRADVDLTLDTVKISTAVAAGYGFYQNQPSVVTMKNCEIIVGNDKIAYSVDNAAATLNMENCKLTSPNRALCVYKGGTVNINGGYYEGVSDSTVQVSDGVVEIKGGHFKATKQRAIRVVNTSSVTIYDAIVENGNTAADPASEAVALENEAYLAVYGGYFCSFGKRFTIRSYHNATVDFYNGYVVSNSVGIEGQDVEKYGAIGYSGNGTSSNEYATANIYGGTFVTLNSNAVVTYGSNEYGVYGGSFYNLSDTATKTVDGAPTYPAGQAGIVHAWKTGNGVDLEAAKTGELTGGISYYAGDIPTTREGAWARLTTSTVGETTYGTGLRFVSDIGADTMTFVKTKGDKDGKITFGTIICPTEYLADIDVFTMEALDAADKTYLNIVATDVGTKIREDGSVSIYSAITDIKAGNYTKDFSAVAYVTYEKDGETVYIYGLFDSEKNTRNIAEVAAAALADTTASFTADEQAILNTYAGN